MKAKRRVKQVWQTLRPQGILAVHDPRVPSGEPWPQADIVIWEKVSARRMRLRDGIVSIEMTPGEWWAHGELLHYARSWPAMTCWVDHPDQTHLWAGQRIQLIPASGGEGDT